MPNWIKGNIKIRGEKEDVTSFVENEILKMYYTPLFEPPKIEKVKFERGYYEYSHKLNDENKEYYYLNDSRRCFFEQNEISIDVYSYDEDCQTYLTLEFKQAWDIETELFQKLSKKYNLDFNIYASEKGMEFERYITIIKGEITRNEEKEYDDWYFEAINPELGG